MLTVKDLMTSDVHSSPDGIHWEPSIPVPMWGWRYNWRDAWAVLNGRAVAVRQTTEADIRGQHGRR